MSTTTEKNDTPKQPVMIKKYANRRLYNTETSVYVTLEDLAEMVQRGDEFTVTDAKTGEDLTRSVLTQIISEMEGRGQNMLPISFLRQLIKLYGDSLQGLVPGFLDMSLQNFTQNKEHWQKQMTAAFGMPMNAFEEQVKQNMKMFENAFSMFSPFPVAPFADKKTDQNDIESMRAEMRSMKEQISKLKGGA
ncbi:MAG: polyhydroxyalkanoate synthesis repressor PhaR [Pseudomonadota bacterium]